MAVATRRPALVVPDRSYWASLGVDLEGLGIEPVGSANQAELLVLGADLPEGLLAGVRELGQATASVIDVRVIAGGALRPPTEAERGLLRRASGQHWAERGSEDHGDQGHGEMMAVTGAPSADGLVMEGIETRVGPISPALPAGLVVDLDLDGDVVHSCRIEATLTAAPDSAPDPLARAAWRWAELRAGAADPSPAEVARQLAATEVERALSHSVWLVSFAELLGWPELADATNDAGRTLIGMHAADGMIAIAPSSGVARRIERPLALLDESRRLRRRTEGLGTLTVEDCRRAGLAGPVARASGAEDDLRSSDPAYRALDFEPVLGSGGDAAARARLRAEEAAQSLRLARAALEAGTLPAGGSAVEGPRGPVSAAGGGPVFAGGEAALRKAGDLAAGHELAGALVVVSSFDLSPWSVG